MRVLFAGTPEAALPSLRALIDSPDHEVVGVLTRPDARRGRGRTLSPSPVAALARAAGLDVRTPATLRDAAARGWVRSLGADVAVVVAYGRIVPPALLDAPAHGWINLHFSLLPAWRGAAPVQRAVMAGDAVTGACVFRLEEGLDTGPVYARLSEPIGPRDTGGDLLARLPPSGDLGDQRGQGVPPVQRQAGQGVEDRQGQIHPGQRQHDHADRDRRDDVASEQRAAHRPQREIRRRARQRGDDVLPRRPGMCRAETRAPAPQVELVAHRPSSQHGSR